VFLGTSDLFLGKDSLKYEVPTVLGQKFSNNGHFTPKPIGFKLSQLDTLFPTQNSEILRYIHFGERQFDPDTII
jgi:hypothetical protein